MEGLYHLDLSRNDLSGNIPPNLGNCSNMVFLNLNKNELFGSFPSSLVALERLATLVSANNQFSGELPQALKNWSSLITLDLSYNELAGNILSWIGKSLSRLKYLNLRSNKFIGRIPPELSQLSFLQVLDLIENRLLGPISKSFGNFTAMREKMESLNVVAKGETLNYEMNLNLVKSVDLSSKHLMMAKLKQLQLLELSNNQLSKVIPPSISSMTSLRNQMETFDASIYSGNPYLCLPPPIQGSKGKPEPPPSIDLIERSRNRFKFPWLDMSIELGFGVGFGGTILLLFIRKSWTDACFHYIDKIVTMLLWFCKLKWKG
ncbi:hypothetical protein AMTRI_Chr05g69660 [Amborella trichopoda]